MDEDCHALDLIHTIQLSDSEYFGVKCFDSASKCWIFHNESIFYFQEEKGKFPLHELNLNTDEH